MNGRTDGRTDRQNQLLNPAAAYAPRGNNNTGGNDGLVGELFRYGGKGVATCSLLEVLYEVVWTEESVPKQQRQVLTFSLYKKGDTEDLGIYRGITLLNVGGKLF